MNAFETRIANYERDTCIDTKISGKYDMKVKELKAIMGMINIGDLASVGTALLLVSKFAFAKGYRAGRKASETHKE